jgi:large subunit ribosomal protein L29
MIEEMKASVIREMTTQEVRENLDEERISYSKMKMAHHISPLENPLVLRAKRKVIARLETELRRRKMEETA